MSTDRDLWHAVLYAPDNPDFACEVIHPGSYERTKAFATVLAEVLGCDVAVERVVNWSTERGTGGDTDTTRD